MAGTSQPVRLQLSRRRGFNLQAASLAHNGRPATNVARPSRYGNPFKVAELGRAIAIARFRLECVPALDLAPLRGRNLACWCGLDEPCHADVLLELAN